MKKYFAIPLAFLILLTFACSPPPQTLTNPSPRFEDTQLDGLKRLEGSILKITCSAYYENYYYSDPAMANESPSQQSLFINKKFTTNSVAGTGLIVLQYADKILMLSCHHVFSFEDTIRTYYLNEKNQLSKYLQSLSIRYGQTIYVTHRDGTNSLGKIIVFDEANDIALIETEASAHQLSEFPFQGLFDKTTDIKLGQEIYLLGFPKGMFLVTRGLATPSKYKNKFITDVSFNRGFSGGIAIAFNYPAADFHYIGMATSTAYDSEFVIAPSESFQNIQTYRNVPFKEDVYLKDLKMINYGITFVTKSEVILDFFKKESESIKQMGYHNISTIIK